DGTIIAKSFDKFHNIEDNRHLISTDFVVQEKYDGSLIILFYYDQKWHVASRGSFESEQALKAEQILNDQYSVDDLDKSHSYIFEIIYPSNRIVVDYGGETKLVYLASFLPTGQEFFEKDLINWVGEEGLNNFYSTLLNSRKKPGITFNENNFKFIDHPELLAFGHTGEAGSIWAFLHFGTAAMTIQPFEMAGADGIEIFTGNRMNKNSPAISLKPGDFLVYESFRSA
ncbi:MAG: hypothetical protein EOO01_21890, partial [Chitinophagaceae bacterium]